MVSRSLVANRSSVFVAIIRHRDNEAKRGSKTSIARSSRASRVHSSAERQYSASNGKFSASNQSGRSAAVISFHCLRSLAVSPAGGTGSSFALILTGVTPIVALEIRPRLRMRTPPRCRCKNRDQLGSRRGGGPVLQIGNPERLGVPSHPAFTQRRNSSARGVDMNEKLSRLACQPTNCEWSTDRRASWRQVARKIMTCKRSASGSRGASVAEHATGVG